MLPVAERRGRCHHWGIRRPRTGRLGSRFGQLLPGYGQPWIEAERRLHVWGDNALRLLFRSLSFRGHELRSSGL